MSQEPSTARHPVASQLLRFDPTIVEELADRLSDVLVQRVLDAIRAEELIPRASEAEAWLSAKEVAKPANGCTSTRKNWVPQGSATAADRGSASRPASSSLAISSLPPLALRRGPPRRRTRPVG
jgi:hypothetical protein